MAAVRLGEKPTVQADSFMQEKAFSRLCAVAFFLEPSQLIDS